MIKVAFISSVADIKRVHALGHIEMALTHLLLESQPYANHFRRVIQHREVILDNSIMELGDALAGDTVLSVAKEFMPAIVVAPDSFNNRKETVARTVAFIRAKKKNLDLRGIKTMAVAHGRDWEQWKECFDGHQANDQVDMIGLPYGTTFSIPGVDYKDLGYRVGVNMRNRIEMSAWVAKKYRGKAKPCHLLGASDPIELVSQKKYAHVVSHDSSSAYACGYHKLVLSGTEGLAGKDKFKMDFSWKADELQMAAIEKNAKTILSMVK